MRFLMLSALMCLAFIACLTEEAVQPADEHETTVQAVTADETCDAGAAPDGEPGDHGAAPANCSCEGGQRCCDTIRWIDGWPELVRVCSPNYACECVTRGSPACPCYFDGVSCQCVYGGPFHCPG